MRKSKILNTSECISIIDLLRHGATGDEDVFRGHIDLPLSETGWQQMQRAIQLHPQWDFIVSSPLMRCCAFAQKLSGEKNLALHIEERFREISFGQWEGKTPQSVWESSPDALRAFWQDADQFPPPQGERLSHFQTRVIKGFGELVERFRGQHGMIVCHGGVIRMLVAHVLTMPLQAAMRIEVPYACVTRLHIYHHESEDDVMSLAFHNGQLQ